MDFLHERNRISLSSPQGELLAEITFPAEIGNVVNINHTYVHPDLRGQQMADQLMRQAIADITASGRSFRATCPYAVRWLERHREYQPAQ